MNIINPSGGAGSFVPISGGTMTGTLTLNPSSQTGNNDAATIGQLATFVSGQAWKSPAANAASLANINISAPGASLDGYTFVTAGTDSFVAKNQTTTSENGIYTWNGPATPATRRTDANTSGKLTAATIGIISGTQAGSAWTQTTANPVIGTDPVAFTDVGKIYLAGSGLTLTGNSFSIATGGIVNSMVNAAAAIAYSKLNLTGNILNADISASAAIARSKIASGTANRIVINDGSGVMVDASAIMASRALQSDASGIPVASSVTSAELAFVSGVTSAIQTQFNTINTTISGLQPLITAGTTAQYYRGDKSFQTLDTSVVPENGNLYFTNARARSALIGTSPITYNSGTGAIGINTASSSVTGALTATDWTTFNGKFSLPSFTNKSVLFANGTTIVEDTAFNYDSATGLLTSKGHAITGTAGAGNISFALQSSTPATPGSGLKLYSDNSGRFNILNSGGKSLSLDTTGLSASRAQVYPDANGTFGLVPASGFVKSNGSLLSSVSSIVASTDISGLLPAANGGTNSNSSAATGIAHVTAGAWAYSAVDLASADVTGVLPLANGGSASPNSSTRITDDYCGGTVAQVWTTSVAGTGASAGQTSTSAALGWRPGIAQYGTGTTAAGRSGFGQSASTIALGNGVGFTYEVDISIPVLSTGVDRFGLTAGFNNSFGLLLGTNYAGFSYVDNVNGGAWVCTTTSTSVSTTTNTGTTVAINTWYRLTITVNSSASSVTFSIDGTTVATHTTNIPVGAPINTITNIMKTVGTTARVMNIDYSSLLVQMATAR
jgi:hypothetical protein